jgi:hypothetical protein
MNGMSLQILRTYEVREAYLYHVDKTTINIEKLVLITNLMYKSFIL